MLRLVSFITRNSPLRFQISPSRLRRSPLRFQISPSRLRRSPLRFQISPTPEHPKRSRGPWKHLAGAGCLLALNAQPLAPQLTLLPAQEIVSPAQVGFRTAQVAVSRAKNPSREPFLTSPQRRKSSPQRRLRSPQHRKPHCHNEIRKMLTDHSQQNQSGFADRQIAANFLKAPLQSAHGLYQRTLQWPLRSRKPAGHDELFQGRASPPQVAPRTRPNVRRRFHAARATVALTASGEGLRSPVLFDPTGGPKRPPKCFGHDRSSVFKASTASSRPIRAAIRSS